MSNPPAALTAVLTLIRNINGITTNPSTNQKLSEAGITGKSMSDFLTNMSNVTGPIGGLLYANGVMQPSGPPPPYTGTNHLGDLSTNLSNLKAALTEADKQKLFVKTSGFPTISTIQGNIDKVIAALPKVTGTTESPEAAQRTALSSLSSTIKQAITNLQSGGGMGVATIQRTIDNLASVPRTRLSGKGVNALQTATTVLSDLKSIQTRMAESLTKASSLIDTAQANTKKGGKGKNKKTRRQKKSSRRKRYSRR
jgi:hypothetical protein